MNINQKGLAGEFYALAQLTARGYNASLTLGNTKGVDILVMNEKNNIGYKIRQIDFVSCKTFWQGFFTP